MTGMGALGLVGHFIGLTGTSCSQLCNGGLTGSDEVDRADSMAANDSHSRTDHRSNPRMDSIYSEGDM